MEGSADELSGPVLGGPVPGNPLPGGPVHGAGGRQGFDHAAGGEVLQKCNDAMKQLYELMYDEDGRKLLGPGGAISSVGTPDTGSLISILQSTPSRWETLDNSSGTLPYQTSRFTWLMNPSTVLEDTAFRLFLGVPLEFKHRKLTFRNFLQMLTGRGKADGNSVLLNKVDGNMRWHVDKSTSHHDYVIYLVLGHKDNVSIILSTVIEDSAPSDVRPRVLAALNAIDELHVSVGFPDLAGLTGTVVKTGQAVTVCGTDREKSLLNVQLQDTTTIMDMHLHEVRLNPGTCQAPPELIKKLGKYYASFVKVKVMPAYEGSIACFRGHWLHGVYNHSPDGRPQLALAFNFKNLETSTALRPEPRASRKRRAGPVEHLD